MTRQEALALASSAGFLVGSDKSQTHAIRLINAVLERAARIADQRGDCPVYPGWEVSTSVRCRVSEARIIAGTIREQKVT